MTVRVLHVFGGMNVGGAERFAMNVFREIRQYGIMFDFAVNTSESCHYDGEIRTLGGRVFPHPSPQEVGFRQYGKALRRTLEQNGPFTAVHSHVRLFSGYVLRTAENARVPLRIAHCHSMADGQPPSLQRKAYQACMVWLLKKHSTHLFGCARAACEAIYGNNCWKDSRVQIVPNAIAIDEYADSAADVYWLRRHLGLPDHSLLIGHIGSFRRVKNHMFLLDLFAALAERRKDAYLILIGDGPLRQAVQMEVLARHLESRVHMLGTRQDVPRLLGGIDVVVFPSLWEGIPVSLIEAQARGTPCVISDVVSREIDAGIGLTRFVSLSSGTAAWLDAIFELSDLRRPGWDLRRKALENKGYDVRRVGRWLAEVYARGTLEKTATLPKPALELPATSKTADC